MKKSKKKIIISSVTVLVAAAIALAIPLVYFQSKNNQNDKVSNHQIIAKASSKPLPTLKEGATEKTANELTIEDFIDPPKTNTLTFKVMDVKKTQSIPDGTTATVQVNVYSIVRGNKVDSYSIEMNNFKSEFDKATTEIQSAILRKEAPLKIYGTEWKTASQLNSNDFIDPLKKGTLIFWVGHVKKSTSITDGTTVTVTIHVTSTVSGTTTQRYDVDVNGYISEESNQIRNVANGEIDKEVVLKPSPRLKSKAISKTASKLTKEDFVPPIPKKTSVNFEIESVCKSPIASDGTVARVRIKVTSDVPFSKTEYYIVDVNGFKSE